MLHKLFNQNDVACDFRAYSEFDNHELVVNFTDTKIGLKGAIAIHNTNLGPALGGTRMQAYAHEQDALRDALRLSRAMSYKCALAGLPYGGGKAVVMHDPDVDRDRVLEAYAKAVEKLGGLFKTGTDVGVMDTDVLRMSEHTAHMLGVTEADRGDMSTGKTAALGTFHGIKAALRHKYGTDDMHGKTIGIKGLGKLGGELARLSHAAGATVIAADLNEALTARLTEELPGVRIVASDQLHALELNVYAPCALGNELDTRKLDQLRCDIVAGGANNQLISDDIGTKIFEKGILYAPDYIINAGGLIYVADELEPGGFNKDRIRERVEKIDDTLTAIFERSRAEGLPTSVIADQIARERLEGAAI